MMKGDRVADREDVRGEFLGSIGLKKSLQKQGWDVNQFGPAVMHWACKRKASVRFPASVLYLFNSCGVDTALLRFAPHNNETMKWILLLRQC